MDNSELGKNDSQVCIQPSPATFRTLDGHLYFIWYISETFILQSNYTRSSHGYLQFINESFLGRLFNHMSCECVVMD